jgi:hypothetical protein
VWGPWEVQITCLLQTPISVRWSIFNATSTISREMKRQTCMNWGIRSLLWFCLIYST